MTGRRGGAIAGVVLLIAGLGGVGTAQTPIDAAALVRRAVDHRLEAGKTHRPVEYLLRRVDEHRDTTKAIVETKDGDVARLVAEGGKPLSPDADQAELARLDTLAAHPEMQEHRKKSEEKDAARVDRLLGMLPDAFLYKLEGMEACAAGQCYRLSFTPNPKWSPPDLEAKFFRGIAGQVWIDQAQERLTRLDANFIADVDFGFGILGKLNKGSTVSLEQTDVGGGDWELTGLTMHVTGRAVWKQLSFQVKETTSGYVVVPAMGYREGIALLKKGGAEVRR